MEGTKQKQAALWKDQENIKTVSSTLSWLNVFLSRESRFYFLVQPHFLRTVVRTANMMQSLWRAVWQFLIKLNKYLLYSSGYLSKRNVTSCKCNPRTGVNTKWDYVCESGLCRAVHVVGAYYITLFKFLFMFLDMLGRAQDFNSADLCLCPGSTLHLFSEFIQHFWVPSRHSSTC